MKNTLNGILVLTVGFGLRTVSAADLGENEVDVVVERQRSEMRQAVDLRVVIPVMRLVGEPALRGISYSASAWALDAEEGPVRTAEIVASPGEFVAGKFISRGEPVTVLAATSGEGTVVWVPKGVSKTVYQLAHAAMENGVADESQNRYGYFDFSHAEGNASQAEVEKAVLSADTSQIVVVQDDAWPWQPIDYVKSASGIKTDAGLSSGTKTATAFGFWGRGVLYCEYALGGGTLEVRLDGELLDMLPSSGDWQPWEIAVDDYGAHEVVFAHTSAGDGQTAALRGVRWSRIVQGVARGVRMDLYKGVRKLKRFSELMPLTYSSTNWIGDVDGVIAESNARLTVVRLLGTDPIVTNWTDVVSGSYRILHDAPGEGEVNWKPGNGVWKAEFDILNGAESIHHEETFFDLRNTRGSGMAVIIF